MFHIRKGLDKDKKGEEDKNKKNESKEINAFMGVSTSISEDDCCMDTGATEHMCWNKNLFTTLKEIREDRKVKIRNRSVLEVKGVEEIRLNS